MTQLKYLFYIFVHLLDSIRILKLQLLDYNYMYIHNNLHEIKLQFPLFLATVLTNNLVILSILFLQCNNTPQVVPRILCYVFSYIVLIIMFVTLCFIVTCTLY